MNHRDQLTVFDKNEFRYLLLIDHFPHLGFSNVSYNGDIIGQPSIGKLRTPVSDDDKQWEEWDERFSEWKDEIKVNAKRMGEEHFNKK